MGSATGVDQARRSPGAGPPERPEAPVGQEAVDRATGRTLALEVESPLEADVNAVAVLDNAIEVFQMGKGRTP